MCIKKMSSYHVNSSEDETDKVASDWGNAADGDRMTVSSYKVSFCIPNVKVFSGTG